jgi:hypothetical protein
MKIFRCGCDQDVTLFFDSVSCTVCGRMVGYCPDRREMYSFDLVEAPNLWKPCGASSGDNIQYRQCHNYHVEAVCNWMVLATDPNPYCSACRLNGIIPDLTPPRHREYWAKLEAAKRRTLHTLLELGLPISGKTEDPNMGLHFLFLADKDSGSEFTRPLAGQEPVYTGHNEGEITINLAEADEIARERTRVRLGENYRTLLGHFRHETGHYFWFKLITSDDERVEQFRALFGDERADYQQALDAYYENGPKTNWGFDYLTAYSTMHPWEDWAETWAHYLHMVDTLDTAMAFELQMRGERVPTVPLPQDETAPASASDFDTMVRDWMRLAVGLNALNRSMGLQDAYPFVLTAPVQKKLRFVHDLIVQQRERQAMPAADSRH